MLILRRFRFPIAQNVFDWAVAFFMMATILLSLFYIYPSGHMQPAYFLMLISAFTIIIIKFEDALNLVKSNIYLLAFVALVVLINSFYGWYFHNKEFFVNTLYWIYNITLLISVMLFSNNKRYYFFIKWMILVAFVLIIACYLLGFGKYTYWPRYNFYFNGPNQLGYFSILMLLIFFVVNNSRLNFLFLCAYTLSIFVLITTGGRSTYLALVPLALIFTFFSRKQLGKIILLLLIPIMVFMIFDVLSFPLYFESSNGMHYRNTCSLSISDRTIKRIDKLNPKISSTSLEQTSDVCLGEDLKAQGQTIKEQLIARGYNRIYMYPRYFLYGAGQGFDERFGGFLGVIYEIHSSFLALLFYYGFLGFFLFSIFIYRLFHAKENLILLLSPFVYGLFTYGLRAPYFWVALGFLAVMPSIRNENINSQLT